VRVDEAPDSVPKQVTSYFELRPLGGRNRPAPRMAALGGDRAYVGVMAQEVQPLMPEAVQRDRDGVLRVRYDKLGIQFQTYEEWLRHGARIPRAASNAQ